MIQEDFLRCLFTVSPNSVSELIKSVKQCVLDVSIKLEIKNVLIKSYFLLFIYDERNQVSCCHIYKYRVKYSRNSWETTQTSYPIVNENSKGWSTPIYRKRSKLYKFTLSCKFLYRTFVKRAPCVS